MTDLTGKTIANTYKQLLRVGVSTNTGVSAGLATIESGDGTDSSFQLATNSAKFTGTLVVDGATSIADNLHVDEKVCASAFYGDGSNISGVTATIAGNISVSNAIVGGNLYVSGTATIVGATHLQAALSVGGAAQFGSTVTVSGAAQLQSTVTAVGEATFKSRITVENVAALKNNVTVGGIFNVAGASGFTSKATFSNDVSVSGRLDVATSVCIGGVLDVEGVANFATNISVSGNANIVGNVTAAFYYGDGSNLTNVEAEIGTATNISVSGFVNVGGNLSVSGTSNVVGAATFKDDVSISGTTKLLGTVTATGNTGFLGTVRVSGATSLEGALNTTGAALFSSTVTVVGATHLQNTVSVAGGATFASTVTILGANLQAVNARVCASSYYGDGSNLTGIAGGTISGNISVSDIIAGGTLRVSAATSLEGALNTTGAALFSSTVTVVGAGTFKSNISVSGNVDIAGNVSAGGTLNVGGNVGIGTTAPAVPLHISSATPSIRLTDTDDNSDAQISAAAGGLLVLDADVNNEVAGSAILFRVDGGSEKMRIESGGVVRPGADNTQSIGAASYRWSVVYAGTGTINTSDEREKQQIANLDDAERRVAVAIKGLVKKYKYNDAVALKGDDARIHVGVIAQEVIAAFAAEGLDATRYALLCHDTWEAEPEEVDKNGNVINPGIEAGERYGIRYDELLAFMIAAL